MAVRFVIGRAGSGKSQRIFDLITSELKRDPLGPPLFLILPRQATFVAERQLSCASGLNGFSRARVVSFDLFASEIFNDCGGSSIPLVTPLGRQMILGHLLRLHQSELRFFGSVARQPGLAFELDSTFEELERSGKGVEDLDALVHRMSGAAKADNPLLAKMTDLIFLYRKYIAYLGQGRLDQHQRRSQVISSLKSCSLLPKARIYVDEFAEFTPHECDLLTGAAQAGASIEISLLIDPDSPTFKDPHHLPEDLSFCHVIERMYRRLYFSFESASVHVEEPVVLRRPRRFQLESLLVIERGLFGPLAPTDVATGICFIEAANHRDEADAIARAIRDEIAKGKRLRDIAVLVRDLTPYHAHFAASFAEHGISYFLDRRRSAAHHPLLQTLRAIFSIVRFDWSHDAVMSLLKSGLAGLSADQADRLENYVLAHRLFGAAAWQSTEPWNFHRRWSQEAKGQVDPVEQARQGLLRSLLPLIGLLSQRAARPLRSIAAEIFQTFERLGVRQTLSRWMAEATAAGRLEQSEEHEQVWGELTDLFEQMVDLLGDVAVEAAEFVDILESGLDSFDLALTPPTVDQVLVGQVDRTRWPRLKVVFVAGMNEGVLPAVPRDRSVLSDRERREISKQQLELDPGLHRRQLDERYFGYLALTRASEALYLSRSVSDDTGRPLGPSPFWQRATELCPLGERRSVQIHDRMNARWIATPRQLVTTLMHWARGVAVNDAPGLDGGSPSPWPALYQWLAGHPCRNDELDVARIRAWKALRYDNNAELSIEARQRLFPDPKTLVASPSELETFAACPFKHFLAYQLDLRERDDHDIGPQDLGQLYHRLLDRLIAGTLRLQGNWDPVTHPVDEGMIRACVDEIGSALLDQGRVGPARHRYLLDRVSRTLADFIERQREFLMSGRLRPAHAGLTFGHGGRLKELAIETPGGARLRLHGKIDRVDLTEAGEAAIFDYKLNGDSLRLDAAYWGLSLQLLTALLVLQDQGRELAGSDLRLLGAFYLQLVRRFETVDHPDEVKAVDERSRRLATKPRGVFLDRAADAFDRAFAGGASKVLNLQLKKDGQLGYRAKSDAAEPAEFHALLRHTRVRLGELTDRVLSGDVTIAPYRMARNSPCPRCQYRSVCRFETSINSYRHLPEVGRVEVLRAVMEDSASAPQSR